VRYVRFGPQTWEDWARLKAERLDPEAPGRIGDLVKVAAEAKASGMPVFVHVIAHGWLRNWMGVEDFKYS
jgi:hypothetical protein